MRLVYADHHISPFEAALTKFFVCTDRHISLFEAALTKFFVCTDRHISPFEGSPRAGAAEYVQRGGVYTV